VAGNLVAIRVHVGNNASPVLVDRALAEIVASDEESGLRIVGLELVQHLLSVDVGTVIVGNGNSLRLQASADTDTSILDASELATIVVGSRSSVRGLVRVTSWTKVDLAVRCCAEIFSSAAVSLSRVSLLLHAVKNVLILPQANSKSQQHKTALLRQHHSGPQHFHPGELAVAVQRRDQDAHARPMGFSLSGSSCQRAWELQESRHEQQQEVLPRRRRIRPKNACC
jgi:hypothetical protein